MSQTKIKKTKAVKISKVVIEAVKEVAPLKLDISYGPVVQEGFQRVEVIDWKKVNEYGMPAYQLTWPHKDSSVEEIHSAYILQRLPGTLRGKFFDEAYRVLKPEGKMTVISKYWTSAQSAQDFVAQWPPISENSFLYTNKTWREAAQVDYPTISCDFEWSYGYGYDPETETRGDDTKPFWVKHYTNTVNDLQVVLTKKVKQG